MVLSANEFSRQLPRREMVDFVWLMVFNGGW